MVLEYSEVDGYVRASIEGTAEEAAALVLAIQERRAGKPYTPFEVIKEAVRQAIGDTAVT